MGRCWEERLGEAEKRVPLLLRLLDATGHSPGRRVLDFGCGLGALVHVFSEHGFDAYGCDFASEMGVIDDHLRQIETPYRVPFDTDEFDCVVSAEVFEHVQDYGEAFREIRRVLRPGGVSLNVFPPRYSLLERHTFIPLGTIVQSRAWLRLWATLGIRNQFQHGWTAAKVTEHNHRYLRGETTYYGRRRVLREARTIFPNARMIDRELLNSRESARARRLARVVDRLPVLLVVWSEMKERALLLEG